jgi:hypothetical protein
MNDTNLITFKAISTFVKELSDIYGKKHRPLKLYSRLINKTLISHDKVILKHLDVFKNFCVDNRDAIVAKDNKLLKNDQIKYSSKVYIDIPIVFNLADQETKTIIWNHILCISALLDPSSKAKEILRKNMEDGKTGTDETDFLTNIINKVETSVGKDTDPMAAVSSIMSSGIFTDLIGGMQTGLTSGKLDLGKLLGAVQGMVSSLGEQAGGDAESAQAMNMLNGMTSMLGNIGGNKNNMEQPDLSKMTECMTSMMQNMGGNNNVPKKQTNIEEINDNP